MWVNVQKGVPFITNSFNNTFLGSVLAEQIIRDLEGRPEIVVSGVAWQ